MAVTSGFIVLCCLWLLWAFSSNDNRAGAFFLGSFGAVVLGVGWVVLAVIGIDRYRAFMLAAIVPGVVVTTLILLLSGLAGKIGWAFSKPAMDRAAVDCTVTADAGRIGLFDIGAVHPVGDGGCSFALKNQGFGHDGYAYFPRAAPTNPGRGEPGTRYKRYDGNWFTYDDTFESWV